MTSNLSDSEHTSPRAQGVEMDPLDGWLLNQLQADFPIVGDPWSALGSLRHLTGAEVLKRVIKLKDRRIIRQISPIFDTKALGYQSTLVAAVVATQRLEQAAQIVNQHPGVSHNYQRDAKYNLWFTLAVPPGQLLANHLQKLAQQAGLDKVLPLPNLRLFRIRVQLDMSVHDGSPSSHSDFASSDPGRKTHPAPGSRESRTEATPAPDAPQTNFNTPDHSSPLAAAIALTEQDKRIIRLVQDDLPLVDHPFEAACQSLGMSLGQLQEWFERMKQNGVMRRFAAILRHRAAGFNANGMGVWQVPADRIEQAGQLAADCPQVSHCYQRPDSPDWPFNLYTMIHARTPEQCQAVVDQLAAQLAPMGVQEHRVLYSTREFKKVRLRYFVDE